MSQITSETYINALLVGDNRIILKIHQDIFPKINSFVLKNSGTSEDAQEVFQKALYQLTARIRVKKFEITSSFEAYLFTACKNLWRRELNKRKRGVRNESVIELTNEHKDDSQCVIEQKRWELFDEKLNQLSDRCKALLKAYFSKMPYEGIVEKF